MAIKERSEERIETHDCESELWVSPTRAQALKVNQTFRRSTLLPTEPASMQTDFPAINP
tara:strand:- start:188 stop:364 length:177 start_codon:yes stop_codon:yes gene_type:complete